MIFIRRHSFNRVLRESSSSGRAEVIRRLVFELQLHVTIGINAAAPHAEMTDTPVVASTTHHPGIDPIPLGPVIHDAEMVGQ